MIAAEHSFPAPAGARPGILTGLGDYGHSALLRGFQVTAAAPAADFVQVAAGQLVHRGRLVGLVASAVQLDQMDGAAAALAPGQLYYAVLSAGATGITVTKGRRGSVPSTCQPPARHQPGELQAAEPFTPVAPRFIEVFLPILKMPAGARPGHPPRRQARGRQPGAP